MQDFSVEGSPPNVFWVRFSSVGTKFFYWATVLKFGVIFQKYTLKFEKFIEKIGEKMQFLLNFPNFVAGLWGKIRNIK